MCMYVCNYKYICTSEVVVLFAVSISEGDQLPEQQGVFEHPLHWFNQVGLQSG